MKQYRNFKDYHIEKLKDPKEGRAYLELALADYGNNRDVEEFLLAIRDVATAQGGLGKLAQETRLNRQNLYKALSKEGNPQLETIGDILHALGFRLSVEPLVKSDMVS
ncbi:MAG: addiction module antidote protein [Patescibacteria group bacterium]